MGAPLSIFDRAAVAAYELSARHPRRAVGAVSVAFVAFITLAPGPGGRAPAEVLARETYRLVVDRAGVRLVEGHAAALRSAARESGVSLSLLGGIVYAESRGRGGQTSSAGALGLGQLTPAAASDAARRLGLPPPADADVRDDDALNLRLTAAHLGWLLANSQGWSLEQVLVSYNAGRARTFQWLERAGGWEAWVREEEARAARGRPTTGSLSYARLVLAIRARLWERGTLRDEFESAW